jgi:hypothetical protein
MFGPTLPLLLLAIPVAMAALVFLAGLFSRLRASPPLPRAIVIDRDRGGPS